MEVQFLSGSCMAGYIKDWLACRDHHCVLLPYPPFHMLSDQIGIIVLQMHFGFCRFVQSVTRESNLPRICKVRSGDIVSWRCAVGSAVGAIVTGGVSGHLHPTVMLYGALKANVKNKFRLVENIEKQSADDQSYRSSSGSSCAHHLFSINQLTYLCCKCKLLQICCETNIEKYFKHKKENEWRGYSTKVALY